MASDLRFEFTTDNEESTITINREFDAERQLVWDCHTKSEFLDRWFAPNPLTTRTKHMDFREGGFWHFAMVTPDDEKYWSRLDYKTIRPIDGYTARDSFSDEAGTIKTDTPNSDWDVSFSDAGERTLVTTVVQFASPEALQASINMGMKDGLASTMERLDDLLIALKAA